MASRTPLLLFTMFALLLLTPSPSHARPYDLRSALKQTGFKTPGKGKVNHRPRTRTIRAGITVHRSLVHKKTAVKMPRSNVIKNQVAAQKKYADSWTCRESTRMLLKKIGRAGGLKLTLDSSGKGAFDWGAEGKVSFHYYAVDNQASPRLLLDPTASSNFASDARPGGMLHGLLRDAGARLGQRHAAERVARRIARGGIDGLLVLANQADIAVYQDALEAAARIRTGMQRDAQRQ